MIDRTNQILASIDGALADEELRDGMRWSPDPAQVSDAPEPFDGSLVWQPPQSYERAEYRPLVIVDDPIPIQPRPPARTHPPARPARHSHAGPLLPPLSPELREAISADLSARAQRILDDARAQLPSVRIPPLSLELDYARLTARRALLIAAGVPEEQLLTPAPPPDPQQALDALGRIWSGLVEAFRPIAEEVQRIGRALSDLIPPTPAPRPLARAMDAEARRMAALDARQRRNTGPPTLGPERSHAPRRIR